MTAYTPAPIPDGKIMVGDTSFLRDAKGALVPLRLVKPQHQLEDELVRKVMGFAVALSEQLERFKRHCFDDIGAFEALLAQEYDTTLGGPKGNKTLMSYDGLYKITVQVADNIVFGPELQTAKGLIDECLNEWSESAREEIRAIVMRAFRVDREGQINRSEVFMLLRLEIEDPRWKRAMQAIYDAMRVVGSKTYVRCHCRAAFDAPWEPVLLNIASV